AAGQSGVLPTGDAEDVPLRAGGTQVVDEEDDARLDLTRRVDVGLDAEVFGDLLLHGHGGLLRWLPVCTWEDGSVKLLVAALESELQAFPAELPGFDRLVTGPGKLMAAYGLTRALDSASYEEIVVVGTAGAVDDAMDSGIY